MHHPRQMPKEHLLFAPFKPKVKHVSGVSSYKQRVSTGTHATFWRPRGCALRLGFVPLATPWRRLSVSGHHKLSNSRMHGYCNYAWTRLFRWCTLLTLVGRILINPDHDSQACSRMWCHILLEYAMGWEEKYLHPIEGMVTHLGGLFSWDHFLCNIGIVKTHSQWLFTKTINAVAVIDIHDLVVISTLFWSTHGICLWCISWKVMSCLECSLQVGACHLSGFWLQPASLLCTWFNVLPYLCLGVYVCTWHVFESYEQG